MSISRRGAGGPAPPPREKPPQTYHWIAKPVSPERPYGIVSITVGNDSDMYFVQALRSDFGRAFELTKLDGIGRTVYQILIHGKASSCTCLGFEAHRHCKHHDALAAALEAGELPVPAAPSR